MASAFARFEFSGFFLWAYVKPHVYAPPVDNEEALRRRILDVFPVYPQLSHSVYLNG
jgi:hypothetical protein